MRQRMYAAVCVFVLRLDCRDSGCGCGCSCGVYGQQCKTWVCILVCWSGARSRSDERDCIIGHPGKIDSSPSSCQTAAKSPRARPLLHHDRYHRLYRLPLPPTQFRELRRPGCIGQHAHRNSPHSAKSADTPTFAHIVGKHHWPRLRMVFVRAARA
jgi:hypothetical protein